MKKHIILILLLAVALPMMAQRENPRPDKRKRADITELVSDLSAPQKRKIEQISKDSKERVDALRAQQRAVHDSINIFMKREGDQSKVLFPLFEREAQLHVAIDREMYTTKLRIDEVLKPEQRAELRKTLENHHHKLK